MYINNQSINQWTTYDDDDDDDEEDGDDDDDDSDVDVDDDSDVDVVDDDADDDDTSIISLTMFCKFELILMMLIRAITRSLYITFNW